MTQQNHPITPPPELMQQWANAWHTETCTQELLEYIATQAARWGADAELEACVEWVTNTRAYDMTPGALRAARRPKPPSLKKLALKALPADIPGLSMRMTLHPDDVALIRRALEALPE